MIETGKRDLRPEYSKVTDKFWQRAYYTRCTKVHHINIRGNLTKIGPSTRSKDEIY